MEALVVLTIIGAALAYLAARLIALARADGCGGGCGAKNGCPVAEESLRDLVRTARPPDSRDS